MNNMVIANKFFVVSGKRHMGIGLKDLMMMEGGEKALTRLMAFKSSERKDDLERRQNLHGPYEELVILKTGQLPGDYYVEGDSIPWGLRVQESRSNILWQLLSGMLDHRPEFAAAYMGLALDNALNGEEYGRELGKLHQSWADYNATKNVFNNHSHGAMKSQYYSVSCPACSVLTAMVCQEEAMNDLFKKLIPMNLEERNHFMTEQGFGSLLNVMIPTPSILVDNHI